MGKRIEQKEAEEEVRIFTQSRKGAKGEEEQILLTAAESMSSLYPFPFSLFLPARRDSGLRGSLCFSVVLCDALLY